MTESKIISFRVNSDFALEFNDFCTRNKIAKKDVFTRAMELIFEADKLESNLKKLFPNSNTTTTNQETWKWVNLKLVGLVNIVKKWLNTLPVPTAKTNNMILPYTLIGSLETMNDDKAMFWITIIFIAVMWIAYWVSLNLWMLIVYYVLGEKGVLKI